MSSEIIYRCAGKEDIEGIAALVTLCFPEDPPRTESETRHKFACGEKVLIAVEGDKIIACARLDPIRTGMFDVCVTPGRRGVGIGAKTIESAEIEARSLGWRAVKIGIETYNESIIPYYEERGYELTGEYGEKGADTENGASSKLTMMRKKL